MLDLKFIRENPEVLKEMLSKRQMDNPWKNEVSQTGESLTLEKFFDLLSRSKEVLQETEKLRTRRNQISEEFAKLKRAGQDTSVLQKEIESLKSGLSEKEKQFNDIESQCTQALLRLPNFLHDSVPLGKSAEDNPVVRQVGDVQTLPFSGKEHWQLGESLGMIDFERAGKLSGARFSLLKGWGAKLERALINFMLDLHSSRGYTEVFTPFLVTAETMTGTGQLPKFEEELFRLERDQLYLIPTAEVSVTNMFRGELIEQPLPLKFACYSACFRREAGSYGKDTKGLIRNHQFNKIELVWFAEPARAFEHLEELTRDAEFVLQQLKIPYRVVQLCSGDVGFASAKTYDLEVWMPGEKKWREISSCSCFTDFQARRMNIKYKNPAGKKELLYTLNGSGVAVGRLMAAILENYQQADGSIRVPDLLKPYLKTDVIN